MRDRLRGIGLPPLLDHWRHEIALPDNLRLPPLKPHSGERASFQFAFLARMLFSCLVDADFLDTEAFYDGIEGRTSPRSTPVPKLKALRERLDAHLERFEADTRVNQIRADILRHVRQQSEHAPGLFSLTVPTGGGKTLASLAFALDHAVRHGLRRVIFVIPFTRTGLSSPMESSSDSGINTNCARLFPSMYPFIAAPVHALCMDLRPSRSFTVFPHSLDPKAKVEPFEFQRQVSM